MTGRFTNDLSDDDVVQCGYEAAALLRLCEWVCHDVGTGAERATATMVGDMSVAMALSRELVDVVRERFEHEAMSRRRAQQDAA